jgi:hypothetical protein
MKTKLVTGLCVLGLGWSSLQPACAGDNGSPEAVVMDTFVARPACFAATVIGSAVFVVALPFAVLSKSTKKTADILVVKPGKATFTRPLGNFSDLDG